MSSQETPGASSSRGTATPPEATTGTGNLGNRIEDVDIALGQPNEPTAGDFRFEFLPEIDDPEGDYKVQVSAPRRDLPNTPVPDPASELYKEITGEIVDQFYEARFQQFEIANAHACEDDLEDCYTTDDDDSSS